MQAQVVRQCNTRQQQQQQQQQQSLEQACNVKQSVQALRTVISSGIANILYSRGLVPEDCFHEKDVDVGNGSIQGRPAKLRHLKRGSVNEVDRIIAIREGAFDALEKGYLRAMTVAIYLDQEHPNNVVESYTFAITYEREPDTGELQPVLSISERLQHVRLGEGGRPAMINKFPTVRDVKDAVRGLIKHLTMTMDAFYQLPRRCFVNFKLLYTDNTPDNYEPDCFSPGDPGQEKYHLNTHSSDERPEVTIYKPLDTGHHSLKVSVASVARHLPQAEEQKRLQERPDDLVVQREQIEEEHKIQLEDAAARTTVWGDEDFEELYAAETQDVHAVPTHNVSIGMDVDADGSQTPLYAGRPESHRRLASVARSAMDLDEPMQATQLVATSNENDSTQLVLDDSQLDNIRPRTPKSVNSSRIATTTTNPAELASLEWNASSDLSERHLEPERHAPSSLSVESVVIECACGVTQSGDGGVYCASCKKFYHSWCMGFRTNDDQVPESFKCFECEIAGSHILVARKDIVTKARSGFSDLVLFRRTLQLVKAHRPKNMTALRSLLCAPGNSYKTMWKRLENEGFIANRSIRKNNSNWTYTDKLDGPTFEFYFSAAAHTALLPDLQQSALNIAAGGSRSVVAYPGKRQRSQEDGTVAKRVKFSHIKGGIELGYTF
ncbi:HORMA domain-containing protein [Auriculariales sp. MPI-PUGE-AT-0066]|nr:HORMA domain-containing protein [Auriculariales sp. MPI-PUGE-AT-0066]